MEIADFLLARIAEDEEVARASVTDYCDTEWRVDPGLGVVDQYDSVLVYREGDEPFIEHIARWDPARVLAECEVKRRIMEEHSRDGRYCDVCADPPVYDATWRDFPCDTLRFLALPYADHEDWREEWKP